MTWVTLALAAGVPMEVVQSVTGHKTVEDVLKHYFRPGRENFRKTILKAMPSLLSGSKEPKTIEVEATEVDGTALDNLSKATDILRGVTGGANQERVSKALELIKAVADSFTPGSE